jgi:hypothetical protein
MASGFDRIGERTDDDLILGQRREGCDILGERFPCDGEDIAVHETGSDKEFEHGGRPTDVIEVFHEVFPARGKVREEWNLVAYTLEIIECKGNFSCARHGEEVKDAIR